MSLLGAGRSSWCGVWGSPSALGHTTPSHFQSSIYWPGARRSSLTLKLLRVSLRAEYDLELVEIPWGWNYWDSPAHGELLSMLLTKIWVLNYTKVPLLLLPTTAFLPEMILNSLNLLANGAFTSNTKKRV